MKNKFFTQLLLAASLIFANATDTFAQAKSTFAGDVNINPEAGVKYGHVKVSVAYNGDVYVGRLVCYSGTQYTAWEVLKSTDGGNTFTSVTGTMATPNFTHYIDFDMVACGINEADFKLVYAISRINTSTNDARVGLAWYNSAGTNGGVTLESPSYIMTGDRGWESIALSSDTKDPGMGSAPFSITLAAAKAAANDSVIVWTGNDGIDAFTRRAIVGVPGYIRNVSCATGTCNANTYSHAGIVWDEMASSVAEYGNVSAHFIYTDDASDFNYSGPYTVGNANDLYRHPVIAMSNDQSADDVKGCITYEYDGTGSSTGIDIYTRTFNQLLYAEPQITSANSSLTVADGSGNEINPHVAYNPADDKFLFTYYNAGNDALVYETDDLTANITTPPTVANINYRDDQGAMANPMPRVDGLTGSRNFFVWMDLDNTFIDMEIKWPASVQNTSVSVADMRLYPNPATDNITLSFTSEYDDNTMLSIIDMSGRILQTTEANITKGNNKLPLTLNGLPSGSYTLRISGEHANTAVVFTVQH